MRKSKLIEAQVMNASDARRLRELEQENDLLKLLYTDLLQKFAAMKEGFARHAGVC
jgi:hypothetical protein